MWAARAVRDCNAALTWPRRRRSMPAAWRLPFVGGCVRTSIGCARPCITDMEVAVLRHDRAPAMAVAPDTRLWAGAARVWIRAGAAAGGGRGEAGAPMGA